MVSESPTRPGFEPFTLWSTWGTNYGFKKLEDAYDAAFEIVKSWNAHRPKDQPKLIHVGR